MNIFILLYIKSVEQLYGNMLTLNTVRIGFPDAEINVFNNFGINCDEISSKCKEIDARLFYINPEIQHYEFISSIVDQTSGKAIILDPDLIFHKKFDLETNSLLAGKYTPQFICPFSDYSTLPRLHTSFWYINSVEKLKDKIDLIRNKYFEFNPFRPIMLYNNKWIRYDTGAMLYSIIKDETYSFGVNELDCYDHIFAGTSLNEVSHKLPELIEIHEMAKINPSYLKGLHSRQDTWFMENNNG